VLETVTYLNRAKYQGIVDNARTVTRCPLVNFNTFDANTKTIRVIVIAGLPGFERSIKHMRALIPEFDPLQVIAHADANQLTAPTYLQAEVVEVSWRQLTDGVLDERLAAIAERGCGLKRAILYPIVVRGAVVASLCFHREEAFSASDRNVFESFVEQAALTLENAYLLAESRQSRQITTAGEERLRREIAELLHSQVQSKLLVVWHRLGDVLRMIESEPQRAAILLTELRVELDRIREDEVREASHLLHPSIIRVGLIAAVRSLARRFEDYYRLSLDLNPRVIAMDDPLQNEIPEPARLIAYRVIEEALSNAFRHGHARLVELTLAVHDGNRLEIVVRDDGTGFDPATMQRGLGITSIADRIEQVDGEWTITGRPGEGTVLRAEFRFEPVSNHLAGRSLMASMPAQLTSQPIAQSSDSRE
jgi:signal transduction histidine kinase